MQSSQLNLAVCSEPISVLPYDGDTINYGSVFAPNEADTHFTYLLQSIPWRHDEAIIFGKHVVTSRKVAWFGDRNFDYTYSGKTRTALLWTKELRSIKADIERITGNSFNSCLLNLYADGTQGMGWHHDDEKELRENSSIASVSFGATRRFDLRHKNTQEKVSVELEHGSLLVMAGVTQTYWQHQIPKTKKVTTPRVNLTFRQMKV